MILYDALVSGGWAPTSRARVRLAELAYVGLREAMIEEMTSRTLTPDDAPVIAALAGRGEDVEELVDALNDAGIHSAGRLSLAAEGSRRGGLTATADAGAISQTEGDD